MLVQDVREIRQSVAYKLLRAVARRNIENLAKSKENGIELVTQTFGFDEIGLGLRKTTLSEDDWVEFIAPRLSNGFAKFKKESDFRELCTVLCGFNPFGTETIGGPSYDDTKALLMIVLADVIIEYSRRQT